MESRLSRRRFLRTVGLGGAAAALASRLPSTARAQPPPGPWGALDVPTYFPGNAPADGYRVLEIFLAGGATPWESFYHRIDGALTDDRYRFRGAHAAASGLTWNGACATGNPALATWSIGNDANGREVALGPWARPLGNDPTLRSRTRVVVTRHELTPHEAAVPYALTGRRFGDARAVILGAAVERRQRLLAGNPPLDQRVPFAFALHPPGFDFAPSLAAFGAHGAASQPLLLQVEPPAGFTTGLQRTPSPLGNTNDLLRAYRDDYGERLRFRGGAAVVSSAYSAYDYALRVALTEPSTHGVGDLVGGALQPAAGPWSRCAGTLATSGRLAHPLPAADGLDRTGAAIRTAARLLAHADPAFRARYVCVVDEGSPGLRTYDTHADNFFGEAVPTANNLWRTLRAVADEVAAGRLDLATTLVVIKTEFGRTPAYNGAGAEPNGTPIPAHGRDHWPFGYVTVLLGGPTRPGVAGAINDGHPPSLADLDSPGTPGIAERGKSCSPTAIQAALLMAAGIDPFADGNFDWSDIDTDNQLRASTPTGAADLVATRQRLASRVFGVP